MHWTRQRERDNYLEAIDIEAQARQQSRLKDKQTDAAQIGKHRKDKRKKPAQAEKENKRERKKQSIKRCEKALTIQFGISKVIEKIKNNTERNRCSLQRQRNKRRER